MCGREILKKVQRHAMECKGVSLMKQVRIHEISRESSNLCPPRHSDTPSSTSSSILRIFGQPKKRRYRRTDGRTDRRTDRRMDRRTDGHTLL